MTSNNGNGRVTSNSDAAGPDLAEINLYDQLLAFIEPPTGSRQSEDVYPNEASATDSKEHSTEQAISDLPDLTRPSGPLASLPANDQLTFSGSLTKGVCLACGAESGADVVFCVTCGGFIDEVESTIKAEPACTECGERIATDEIFCPACGAVLPST